MTQPYGAVDTGVRNIHSVHHGVEDNEGSALLGSETVPKLREGHASIISSVSNLSNTIVGSGASFACWSCGWKAVVDGPNP